MPKRTKPPKPLVPIGASTLALAQARALALNAQYLANSITAPPDAGLVLTYLVNAGLSIELYFKTFMIAGRGGKVTEEHNLLVLLDEFPPFLRKHFNEAYEQHPTARSASIRLIALKLNPTVPEKPVQESFKAQYDTFDNAIESIARIFVDARYFFERLSVPDWAIFSYPTDAIAEVIHALEATYKKFESGAFAGEA